MGNSIEPIHDEVETSDGPSGAETPPEIWRPDRFSVFRRRFSAQQQRDLLTEDLQAELRVVTILSAVITAGLLLAAITLLLVLYT